MRFRTEWKGTKAKDHLIDHSGGIMLMGSCFAENIQQKLSTHFFESQSNPHGVLFHPLALEGSIGRILDKTMIGSADIDQNKELYFSFDHHSQFNHPDPQKVQDSINAQTQSAHEHLKKCRHLVLSLGTAWVYERIDNGRVVANCHKVAQSKFRKRLLSLSEIETSLSRISKRLEESKPELTIIFTVSPVRHLKDGMVENSRSKALLIEAVHRVVEKQYNCRYFPAFELMLDDLRDYRFYAQDLLHPNAQAVSYIWEKFTEGWMSEQTLRLLPEIAALQKATQHKSLHPETDSSRDFQTQLAAKIKAFKEAHPHIKVDPRH